MATHTSPLFPDSIKERLINQILNDPGVPRRDPTIPIWQKPPHPLAETQSNELSQVTDFAIIGSGVTGCAVAKTILESSQSGNQTVAVFEARTLASGATSRNAGFLKSHIPTAFSHFIDEYGKEEAIVFSRFANRTMQKMKDLVAARESDGDCTSEMRDVQCISAYRDKKTLETVISSIKLYEKCIPEDRGLFSIVDSETLEEVHHLKDFAGALSSRAAVFWPYRLITRVFETLLNSHGNRCSIETNTPVTSVKYSPETNTEYPYVLGTPRGEVRAGHVFHCSNAFVGHLLPRLRGKIYPTRHSNSCQSRGPWFPNLGSQHCWLFPGTSTYDPISGLFQGGLYYMQQNAKTGDLFFGGQQHDLDQFISADDRTVTPTSASDLSTKLPKIFDQGWTDPATGAAIAPEVRCIWSGIIGSTPDHNPIVGKVPISIAERGGSRGGEWIAVGYNGYGMVQCWSSGEAIAQMALGQPRPEWLPRNLLISEERLFDERRMGTETALYSLVAAQPSAGGATTDKSRP